MKTVGIVCEYNPLHLGHQKQIHRIRREFGEDCGIVCVMSGNFVQRGAPAIIDKNLRAKAAVLCGADLVLELPVTYALSSAEGFAAGGVRILSQMCDTLCFGAETADRQQLLTAAVALLSSEFPPLLRKELEKGMSFPAARAAALEQMGLSFLPLTQPNDILAVEYCKAILSQQSAMEIFPIHRAGSYHADVVDSENPSATAVRKLMLIAHNWKNCVPPAAKSVFEGAALHSLSAGERAVLARLRTMSETEFEGIPYGSEGLWRKFMHACRNERTLEDIMTATKSKRYTRTRLDRMMLCAFLGITKEDLETPVPYTRVLAFNDRGRSILSKCKKEYTFVNAGESVRDPYQALEQRCESLYGLFSTGEIESPTMEAERRVWYHRSEE